MAGIDAFLFDIGNVLVGFDFEPAIKTLRRTCKRTQEECRPEIDALKVEYESGRIGRGEFVQEARRILGFSGSDAEFENVWQRIFVANEPMHRLVRLLHGRHKLYHLSNTSDLHMDYIREEYPVFECFGGGTYSWLVGSMKPEEAIYRRAITDLQLNPARTVFIDDLEANIEAAKPFGFLTFQYRIDHHGEFLSWLESLGLPSEFLQ